MWNLIKKICLGGYHDLFFEEPKVKRPKVYRIKGKKYVLKKRVNDKKN